MELYIIYVKLNNEIYCSLLSGVVYAQIWDLIHCDHDAICQWDYSNRHPYFWQKNWR